MIRHLFKLIWTQRRFNLWIVLELFVVSALMWYIVDFLSVLTITASTPTGFHIENTYKLTLAVRQENENGYITYEEDSPEPWLNMQRIAERLRQHPDIEGVSVGSWHFPYCRSNMSNQFWHDTLRVNADILTVTPDYFRVFRVAGSDGNPETLARAMGEGYVISSAVEERLFPGSSAIGQTILDKGDSLEMRVTGVTGLMKRTEFDRPARFLFVPLNESLLSVESENELWSSVDICFRVKKGAAKNDFAERFGREMRQQLQAGNFYLSEVTPLSNYRDVQLQKAYNILNYRIGFAVFFLLNIFLGVIGTFWLRINKRNSEIGLRMAVGSSRRTILWQMVGEGMILLFIAFLPALVVCLNLVHLDLLPKQYMDVTPLRCGLTTVITLALLVFVVVLGTWYPARRSSRIEPAEALHYE